MSPFVHAQEPPKVYRVHFAVYYCCAFHIGLGSHEEAHTTAHYHSERLKESHSRVEFLKTLLELFFPISRHGRVNMER